MAFKIAAVAEIILFGAVIIIAAVGPGPMP